MRCLKPRTVGFKDDGKTIAWSQKYYNKEFSTFKLPCGKCIECRLEYARQWAIRCVHESKMYDRNSFITLTYSDEHLPSSKLQYSDFQTFIKNLRNHIFTQQLNRMYPFDTQEAQREKYRSLSKETRKAIQSKIQIGFFVTGEYGEKQKRPHWHAIIFNWRPKDYVYKYSNERGDKLFDSKILNDLWAKGITELGQVTFESAGYCARYAAKKLVHGHDEEHDFQPISKKSSKNAIGKKFLETFYRDIFNHGYVVLPGGQKTSIPRYYEKWFQQHHPLEWERYVTDVKLKNNYNMEIRQTHKQNEYWRKMDLRPQLKAPLITELETKTIIINDRFKRLQKYLKGDI